jgi:hypothetical protein
MVICVKCLKQQGRISQSMHGCPYDGHKDANKKVHAWMHYEDFINELNDKLPPSFIIERIVEMQEYLANYKAKFNENMVSYDKKLDEVKATYNKNINELNVTHSKNLDKLQEAFDKVQIAEREYFKIGLPSEIMNKNKNMIRPFLRDLIFEIIGSVIGIFMASKLFLPMLDLKIDPIIILINIAVIIVLSVFFLGKFMKKYLNAKRYTDSQEFKDELTNKWREKNGYYEVKSNIKMEKEENERKQKDISLDYELSISRIEREKEREKNKYNNIQDDFKSHIQRAENALSEGDEELLEFYNMDNKTKNWYLVNIYDPGKMDPPQEW